MRDAASVPLHRMRTPVVTEEVGGEALGDLGCGFVHRVSCQVSIPRGGFHLAVTQQLADHRQAFTEREGRNPRTGERIAIGPSSGVSLKAGRALRDALN